MSDQNMHLWKYPSPKLPGYFLPYPKESNYAGDGMDFQQKKGSVVANQTEIQIVLCQRLKRRRLELDKTLAEIAAKSGISVSYYCEIENGRGTQPPTSRMKKILSALEFCETEAYELLQQSSALRGLVYGESELSPEIQALIRDIRLHANQLPARFIKGLRTTIREVVS